MGLYLKAARRLPYIQIILRCSKIISVQILQNNLIVFARLKGAESDFQKQLIRFIIPLPDHP